MPHGPETEPREYHHRDLRNHLLELALVDLEHHGAHSLSLRSLASRCGVSKTAPYRHFPDRDALLGALMEVGWKDLYALLASAHRHASSPLEGLRAMGRGYVAFALMRSGMYRLLFSGEGKTLSSLKGCPEGSDSFGLLLDQVKRCQASGWKSSEKPETIALGFWALVHGVADLALENLAEHPESSDRLQYWSMILDTMTP